jgi:hypothetical protein
MSSYFSGGLLYSILAAFKAGSSAIYTSGATNIAKMAFTREAPNMVRSVGPIVFAGTGVIKRNCMKLLNR